MQKRPAPSPPPPNRLRLNIPQLNNNLAPNGTSRKGSGGLSARPNVPTLKIETPSRFLSPTSQPYPRPGSRGGSVSPRPGMGPLGAYQNQSKAGNYVFKQFRDVKDFTMATAKSGMSVGEKSAFWFFNKIKDLSRRWFTHIFLSIIVIAFTMIGALLFVAIESPKEELQRAENAQNMKMLLTDLWTLSRSKYVNERLWEKKASAILIKYDGSFQEDKGPVWTFWNAVFYCGTIFTTIGYGHIAPTTTAGQAVTIAYAIFGIPLFLIILADFGKLFTRGIKFLWAFVRRLYYTGSCRKVRKTAPVQEMMKGIHVVYDMARRPSQMLNPGDLSETPTSPGSDSVDTPGTFTVDDEFNLPITVAITILVAYMVFGASIYVHWENWTFFESFYFVFISMSTIGFGDYVPVHPMFMMASIIYLVFGLALTSMCINVVQEKLSDTFTHASAKLSETIGIMQDDEDGGTGDEDGDTATADDEQPDSDKKKKDATSEKSSDKPKNTAQLKPQ